jgi:hypothetical protein
MHHLCGNLLSGRQPSPRMPFVVRVAAAAALAASAEAFLAQVCEPI